jgi:hypothetical protein
MKKFILILMTIFLIFAITGCVFNDDEDAKKYSTKKFWAIDSSTDPSTFYQLTAEKLTENSRCEVWAEKGSGVTEGTANLIANEYANNIYTKMVENFGWEDNIPLTNGGSIRMNTMEYAHALATGRISGAKLTILLLDIKDGYQPGVNDSYVGGYFCPYDLLSPASVPQDCESNSLDMIYIDTYPGFRKNIKEVYTTLAHEMQHLMNFTSSAQYRVIEVNNKNEIYPMDTWIDEGLSSAAEQIYSGEHLMDRVEWFIKNGDEDSKGNTVSGKIDEGNNFYVWGNRVTKSEPYPILDDYATVYLFFQWLRLQSSKDIYKEIIKSEKDDQQAVINAFNKKSSGSKYSNWESMLKDWLKANNINSESGRTGYMNDQTLKNIKAHYAPKETTLGLYPGEGVYSYSTSSPSVSPEGYIKYEYLSATKTLLTYNSNPVNYVGKNINIDTLIETGTTTGEIPPAASISISGNFNIKLGSSKISGPFRIGMGDVIRMNKPNNTLKFDGLKTEKVFIDE